MKKIFTYLLSLTLLASTSVTFTSCDDDDVDTVMQIITALLTNGTADIENTAWFQQDEQKNGFVYAFKAGGQGLQYQFEKGVYTSVTPFTYSYDSSQNVLTIGGTNYTVKAFVAQQSLTLSNGQNDYALNFTDIAQLPTEEQVKNGGKDNPATTTPLDNTIWYQRLQVDGQTYIILYNFQTNGKGVYEQYIVNDNNQELDGQMSFTFTYNEQTKTLVLNYENNTSETYTITFDNEKLIMVDTEEQLQYVYSRYTENK
jgi:hypothetical protein